MSEISALELQQAALAVREAAAANGTTHPAVLTALENYIGLLREAGKADEVAKFEDRARQLRQVLIQEGKIKEETPPPPPAPKPQPAKSSLFDLVDGLGAGAASKPAAPVSNPVATTPAAPISNPVATTPAVAASKSEEGVFELSDEMDPSDPMFFFQEGAQTKPEAPAAVAVKAQPDPVPVSESSSETTGGGMPDESAERHLFDSFGEHIATEFDGYIYNKDGKWVGWWERDLEVYIDKDGRYLGQVYEENRFARDSNWQYKHMNFGKRTAEADRPSWGRIPDIGRTTFPRDFEDVVVE